MSYNRVLLKLSGEALAGEKKTGFDENECLKVGKQVKALVDNGIQVAIVIGAGNFWRGRTSKTIRRVKADQIGMLGTVMNCLYVSEIFEFLGIKTSVFTPFEISGVTKRFELDAALGDLEDNKVVFLAGGTGHPYFSTDTATALYAIELETDVILLAKAVDGVYDSDPKSNPNAVRFDSISLSEVVERKLAVMDLAASVLCMENKMPMKVFSLNAENSIVDAAEGKQIGTDVTI